MAQQVKNLPAMQEKHKKHRFELWVGMIPCRRKWQPTLAFLSVKSHGQRSLVGYGQWGHKDLDTTEQLNMQGFPGSSVIKNLSVNAFQPLIQEDPTCPGTNKPVYHNY